MLIPEYPGGLMTKKTKKKVWRKPQVKTLSAGSAENNNQSGNDGTGGHTGS